MMMDVILLERVEKLGLMGDVVRVRPGYARNHLLPRKKALRATAENLKAFENKKAELEADNLKLKSEAEAVRERMEGLKVVLLRQAGETGQLYGSVNARDAAAAVTAMGYKVDRNQLELSKPVKALGLYEIRVRLHPEVDTTVTINVARTDEEAEMQFERGGAISRAALMAEEDAAADADMREAQQAAQREVEAEEMGGANIEAPAVGQEASAE